MVPGPNKKIILRKIKKKIEVNPWNLLYKMISGIESGLEDVDSIIEDLFAVVDMLRDAGMTGSADQAVSQMESVMMCLEEIKSLSDASTLMEDAARELVLKFGSSDKGIDLVIEYYSRYVVYSEFASRYYDKIRGFWVKVIELASLINKLGVVDGISPDSRQSLKKEFLNVSNEILKVCLEYNSNKNEIYKIAIKNTLKFIDRVNKMIRTKK